jgi:hypothetical protein
MRISTITAVAGALCAGATAAAADLDADIRAALEASHWTLTVRADSLDGPGAEWLLTQAANAQFTLLGESHLTAETPVFTGALLHELADDGYEVYVTETGPETTRLVVDTIESGGLDAAEAMLAANPFSIAFLDQREEMRAVAGALDLGYAVWGVDQEFMGSARGLLTRLVAIAPDDDRAVAQAMLDRATEGFAKFASSGDQSGAFLVSATGDDFNELAGAFESVPEAQDIIEQLRASRAVYGAYNERRYYDNNSTRIALMKRNLLRHIERAGWTPLDMPKAVLKAGTFHMGKGHTPMHVLDLGNFANELAIAGGSASFHILVTAIGKVGPGGAFNAWTGQAPHLAPLFDLVEGDQPVVVDLRPLRAILTQSGQKTEAQEELQNTILAFDAAVIYPQFTQADGLYPMPGQ